MRVFLLHKLFLFTCSVPFTTVKRFTSKFLSNPPYSLHIIALSSSSSVQLLSVLAQLLHPSPPYITFYIRVRGGVKENTMKCHLSDSSESSRAAGITSKTATHQLSQGFWRFTQWWILMVINKHELSYIHYIYNGNWS